MWSKTLSEKLIGILRKKALSMDKMDRCQLLGFLNTVLNVRKGFLEKDNPHGVVMMQEVASGALKHLGRVTIDWSEIVLWEAEGGHVEAVGERGGGRG